MSSGLTFALLECFAIIFSIIFIELVVKIHN
jgi:hypothetical protein